jgi:hypothetical protein
MTTKRAKSKTAKPVVAWKGFDANLQCLGYQFEIGKTYTHDGKVRACASGFHACEAPFDVWSYYDFGTGNRFCRVHLSGETDRHDGDSKIAAGTIFIESEVTLGEMIRAGVKYEIETAFAKAKTDSATNASSGDYARNASSGDSARNASSGDSARNASSGHYARNASSGDYATNEASGEKSVIAAAGLYSLAKGVTGTAIAMPYKDRSGQIRFASGVVGEDGVPADTWLKAQDGTLVAA